ncbi:DJ-1/PfpI family protein [Acinetobacter ursingii]|uniref:DJ-1/PfpI family protein n=1 Tax=Acinetobacter ursingii TaxID=108980 RepID=UPI00124ED570|nr:DJ-1/PfpI family protein [Acinetobacter ursingii]
MSKTIAALVTHDFEDLEYCETVHAYRAAGHSVINIEHHEGNIVYGIQRKTSTTIDLGIDDSDVHHFDALFIPGGESPEALRNDERFVFFVRHFANLQKPIFICCYAPQLLMHAGVVKGRRICAMQTILNDLEDAGAVCLNQDVVNDNNLYISSRSPDLFQKFVDETLKVLRL